MCKSISHSQQPDKAAKKKARRRVTFAKGRGGEVGVRVKVIQSTASEQHNLYYSQEEKRDIRESARDFADEVYAQDNSIPKDSIEGNALLSSNANTFAYSSIMFRAFESCHANKQDLNDKELQLLTHWVSSGHSRRGLEKLSVHGLRASMQKFRRKALHEVIETYGTAMANHGYLSKSSEQSLARVYRRFSAPSRRFAALMGQVDEAAVCLEDAGSTTATPTPSATTSSTKSATALNVDPLLDCHQRNLSNRLPSPSSPAA